MTEARAMTETGSIESRIIDIISEQACIDRSEITPESNLKNDLGLDSLDEVEIITECEDVFGISIPDDDAMQFKTVGQAIEYVTKHTP